MKVDIVTLVWTVILAPKEAATVTLAGMKTVFELFDLGYFCFDLSRKIDQVGAFFVSRLKANANPTIVKDLTSSGSGRRRCLVGN